MTPEQLHHNLFLLATAGSAFAVDTLGWLRAPPRLAALAFVPLFSRRIPLGPRSRAALAAPAPQASYRAAALGRFDWSRLPGPPRLEHRGVRFALDAPRARLVARLPFNPSWFAFGGVAVLQLRVEGDDVVVRGRALPWLALTSAGFFGALLALVGPGGPPLIGVFFVVLFAVVNGLAALRTRQAFAPRAIACGDELAARLRA